MHNPKSCPNRWFCRLGREEQLLSSDNLHPGVNHNMLSGYFQDYPEIALLPEAISEKSDFSRIFRSAAPIEVEIGSGRGTFLVSQAQAHPEINFLGIEYTNKVYRYSVDRIGRRGLTNVRIIRTEAVDFVKSLIPDASVRTFHIYYPDPWPKKRHNKRRFFSQSNLDELLRCLVPGGRIQLATDHEDYWQQMESVIRSAGSRVQSVDFQTPAGAAEGEIVGTNYERKYKKEGRKAFSAAIIKIA
jgi:tRNA (guanine-N7-)-methyltransferase